MRALLRTAGVRSDAGAESLSRFAKQAGAGLTSGSMMSLSRTFDTKAEFVDNRRWYGPAQPIRLVESRDPLRASDENRNCAQSAVSRPRAPAARTLRRRCLVTEWRLSRTLSVSSGVGREQPAREFQAAYAACVKQRAASLRHSISFSRSSKIDAHMRPVRCLAAFLEHNCA